MSKIQKKDLKIEQKINMIFKYLFENSSRKEEDFFNYLTKEEIKIIEVKKRIRNFI